MVKFYTFTREKSVSWPNLEKDHVVIDWTIIFLINHFTEFLTGML